MPRRAPPDRLAAEIALSDGDLVALRDQATALGIPLDKWHLVPAFATPWGMVAVVREAERLRFGRNLPLDRALAIAAPKIGLNDETVRSRLRSFYRQARGL